MSKKSIIQPELDKCYVCGAVRDLEIHHAMHGTANRAIADRYSLVVALCADHHRGRFGVHSDAELDKRIKQDAQRAFSRIYSRQLWMRLFRKNYLD